MPANVHRKTYSFITPAYNNPEEVKKLLDSIRPEFDRDPSLETIVVDDCSLGSGLQKVVEASGFARYIRLERNSGPALARNVGAEHAKNDILIFVDSDILLNKDTLGRIREKFEGNRPVEILGGDYDLEPANPGFAARFKSLMVASWRPKADTVTVFVTRPGVIKKEIFNALGGFKAELKTAAVEDYEFARRLMNKGYTIYYDPNITVKHHFPDLKSQVRLFFHRSFMWIYVFKQYGKMDNTCTTPILAVSNVCGFMASFLLAASIFDLRLLYGSAFFLALFILTNLRFFGLTFKYEGLFFTVRSVFMALVISCSIVAGAMWGVAYYFVMERLLKKDSRLRKDAPLERYRSE